MNPPRKVLITGARAPVALDWARIARASGWEVLVGDSMRFPLARFLPQVSGFLHHPPPRTTPPDELGATLVDFLEAEGIDLLVPTCEEVFFLAHCLPPDWCRAHAFFPSPEWLLRMHHKADSLEVLEGLGAVRIPATRVLRSPGDYRHDGESVLKPVHSRFGAAVLRRPTPRSVDRTDIRPGRPWVQQQRIDGEPVCNYALAWRGELVAHAAYRPHYLLNGSAGTFFEPHEDPRIRRFTEAFVARSGWHGQVAFDFLEAGEDLWVLECNPRATSGLHLLQERLTLTASGPRLPLPAPGGPGLRESLPDPVRLGPALTLFALRALLQGRLAEIGQDWERSQDAFQRPGSRLPTYAYLLALGELLLRMLRHLCSFSAATTRDLEWDGEP